MPIYLDCKIVVKFVMAFFQKLAELKVFLRQKEDSLNDRQVSEF